jgi:hypothetical protein
MRKNNLILLIFVYLLIWLISVLVPDLLFGDATSESAMMFTVFVPVQEQNSIYTLNLHYSTLFEFLIPVLFVPLSIYLIYREISKNTDKNKNISIEKSRNKDIIKLLIIGLLLMMFVGLGIHYAGDAIDAQLQCSPEDIDGNLNTFPKLIAYFFDEVFGHKVLYLGMMGILTVLFIHQKQNPVDDEKPTNNINLSLFPFLGAIYGIALAFSFMEGQSAFEFFFICIIQFGISFLYIFKLKGNFLLKNRKYPYFSFYILMNAAVFITLLFFIPQMSSIYPFFPQ